MMVVPLQKLTLPVPQYLLTTMHLHSSTGLARLGFVRCISWFKRSALEAVNLFWHRHNNAEHQQVQGH